MRHVHVYEHHAGRDRLIAHELAPSGGDRTVCGLLVAPASPRVVVTFSCGHTAEVHERSSIFDFPECSRCTTDVTIAGVERPVEDTWSSDHDRPEAIDLCAPCGTEADRPPDTNEGDGMQDFIIETTISERRLVRVRAASREQAHAAAADYASDVIGELWPDRFDTREVSVDADELDAAIVVRQPPRHGPLDYTGYDFAPDDPAGRGPSPTAS